MYEKCDRLYAKWFAENDQAYRILMVYVTEVSAELLNVDDKTKTKVDYKMTDTERRICRMFTEKISFELNDLAIANFQVDEYFTSVPLTDENVHKSRALGFDGSVEIDNYIWAYDIPEVQSLLEFYDSVLVSYSFNDYDRRFGSSGGIAKLKYGSVHFESPIGQALLDGDPMESLLNPDYRLWESMLHGYLHELAHTVERTVVGFFEYHKALGAYIYDHDALMSQKAYFANKAVVNGKTVGIPYEFWQRKVAEVHYEAQIGGWVYNEKRYNGRKRESVLRRFDKSVGKAKRRDSNHSRYIRWATGNRAP